MDKNNRRNENELIRMSKNTRDMNEFSRSKIEISCTQKGRPPVVLEIFKAYADDLKWVSEKYSKEEIDRIAFVTTHTLERISGSNNLCNVWLSEDVDNVMIGADPEFLIKNKGLTEIINARSLLAPVGEMGSDGAMGEIRPYPCKDPMEFCSNIRNIFMDKKYKNIIDNYILVAGCYERDKVRDFPIGGHIHVGNPVDILKVSITNRQLILKTLNKILDELLAIPVSRLDIGENRYNRRAGCKMSPYGGYGFFGELRFAKDPKDPDKTLRLEHRTLSGMWLMHPVVTTSVIGVAKLIIDSFWDIMKQKEFDVDFAFPKDYIKSQIWKPGFDSWSEFPICKEMMCNRSSSDMIKILNSKDNKGINKQFLNAWREKLRKLPYYDKYENFVNLLNDILLIPIREIETYDRTIQKNWIENKKFIVE
jgi:hypothetical protein